MRNTYTTVKFAKNYAIVISQNHISSKICSTVAHYHYPLLGIQRLIILGWQLSPVGFCTVS